MRYGSTPPGRPLLIPSSPAGAGKKHNKTRPP